jgi:hypothetical protein
VDPKFCKVNKFVLKTFLLIICTEIFTTEQKRFVEV